MLNANNTLTIIIDIQQRLVPSLHQSQEFVYSCEKMIKALNILNIPSIITEQYPKGLGTTLPHIHDLLPNSPIIEKTHFSIDIPEIHTYIEQNKPNNLILLGCETHICILQSVLDLTKRNLHIYLPQECVTSRTLENKNNGLQQCREAGAIISNIESLLFQILQDAQHPNFKAISKLII